MFRMGEAQISLRDLKTGAQKTFRLEICYKRGMRNLILRVKGEDLLGVSSPFGVPFEEIKKFVEANSEYVFANEFTRAKNLTLVEFFEESPFAYLADGKYSVILQDVKSGDFFIRDSEKKELLLAFDFSNPNSLKTLFYNFAKVELRVLAQKIAAVHNFEIPKISVRDQKSCWGSRSASGAMSFNWRILLIEPIFQEYIICHEIAHTKFMDHSVSFWIYLNRIFEGAKRIDKRLSVECKKASSCAL